MVKLDFLHYLEELGLDYLSVTVFMHVFVYRKQRSGSELEYTEKLQQYSKPVFHLGLTHSGILVMPVQLAV